LLRAGTVLLGSSSIVSLLAAPAATAAPVAAPAQQASQGGTLVSMVVAEPTSMDIASGSGQPNYAGMSNVYEDLLYWDDNTRAVGGVPGGAGRVHGQANGRQEGPSRPPRQRGW